jgi:hypothetical protein
MTQYLGIDIAPSIETVPVSDENYVVLGGQGFQQAQESSR